jgi:hypothetical protein
MYQGCFSPQSTLREACAKGAGGAMDRTKTIAKLNDQLRKDPNWKIKLRTFSNFMDERDSHWMITPEVNYLPQEQLQELVAKVQAFDGFTPENDPRGEHDFGQVTQDDIDYFWKINYHDLDFESYSVDPVDEAKTVRILFLIKADGYTHPIHPFFSQIGARIGLIDR